LAALEKSSAERAAALAAREKLLQEREEKVSNDTQKFNTPVEQQLVRKLKNASTAKGLRSSKAFSTEVPATPLCLAQSHAK
jgi:hypothetical protein